MLRHESFNLFKGVLSSLNAFEEELLHRNAPLLSMKTECLLNSCEDLQQLLNIKIQGNRRKWRNCFVHSIVITIQCNKVNIQSPEKYNFHIFICIFTYFSSNNSNNDIDLMSQFSFWALIPFLTYSTPQFLNSV